MNDIQGYRNGPVESGASRAKEMSPRAYNLAMSALIFLGFCAMGAGAYFTSTMAFVFGALGVTFPKFFQRVYGIGFGILLATILVEIVLMFMGVSQTITDLIVIVVFAGFIGYDTYVATTVPPTLPNAVLMASNLFVDIINVFLRILNILARRD